jgi:hypothetical protein
MADFTLSEAISQLRPGAQWVLRGNTIADLEWFDTNQQRPSNDEIAAKINELSAGSQTVMSQDLMAQFTPDDATKIRGAIEGNVSFWLLWSALQAQSAPMLVTNARFQAGWSALMTVLGADRMTAIAAALGIVVA